tara:strand:- start:2284 stop:3906 length:1623 start_codon:yes stop_codon:yes gene_type:complete
VKKIKKNIFVNYLKKFYYRTIIFDLMLSKNLSTKIVNQLNDCWHGDIDNGNRILMGYFSFFGETLNYENSFWENNGASKMWKEKFHCFDWLKDLKASSTSKSAPYAREILKKWIKYHNSWSPLEWRSDILGRRISCLLSNLSFYFSSADSQFQKLLIRSLCKQGHFLVKNNLQDILGHRRIEGVKGLIALSSSLETFKKHRQNSLKLLIQEINDQVLDSGCHYLMSPSKHLEFLITLLDIKNYLATIKIKIPQEMDYTIKIMSHVIKLFRHPNGTLAKFNNSNHIDKKIIDQVLVRANFKAKKKSQETYSGFHRISSNKLNFIMDCSSPVIEDIYAGALSFELSVGKQLLVVNCGSPKIKNKVLKNALKSSAAHSTACIDNVNSSNILNNPNDSSRIANVWSKLYQKNNSFWIDSAHSGYKHYFGVIHSRKIHIDSEKKIIRGQDSFSKTKSHYRNIPKKYFIRFHLHPKLEVNVTRSQKKALIKLPDGSGWEFICSEPKVFVNESIYIDDKQKILKSNHILVKDFFLPERKIKWLFKQI